MAHLVPSATSKIKYEVGTVVQGAVPLAEAIDGARDAGEAVASFLSAQYGFPMPVISAVQAGEGFEVTVA